MARRFEPGKDIWQGGVLSKNYKITKLVSAEDIENIINDALDHGSTYWVDDFKAVRAKGIKYDAEALTHGGYIMVHDLEAEKWHCLTLKKVLKGLGRFDRAIADYDGQDADAVLQLAIFGELIYG